MDLCYRTFEPWRKSLGERIMNGSTMQPGELANFVLLFMEILDCLIIYCPNSVI